MRFSDHFSVGQPADADWFDLNVLMDTPLYVDPFLVFDENGEENVWTGAHEEIVDFFAAALDLVKKADGHENSMHWAKAVRFLQFPEPKEFALGLSMGHPEGAGIGPDLALDICRGLDLFRSGGATPTTDSLEWSRLSCTDWGWIASATGVQHPQTPLRGYTQAICLGLGIPAEDVTLNNSGWTAQGSR